MFFVAGENLVPILVALLIGFITGLWIWKLARRPAKRTERVLGEDAAMRRPYVDNRPPPAPSAEPRFSPRPEPEVLARRGLPRESDGVASGAAAAVEDVADQFMGIDSHASSRAIPGQFEAAADDLQIMKGVGPKLASLLRAEGVTRFEQIANLGPDDLVRLDAHLGAFKGRLVRDRIVEQAAFLARGDVAGYEREFGKL